ncbi:DUF4822 domain-containing protein [Corticicoccus populi]|uniref:DUF4822 domain-containing protein n=1 Tax=Corticicoccus populi TaxID=1812821 RepID=A0ABW5WWP6_9STAP
MNTKRNLITLALTGTFMMAACGTLENEVEENQESVQNEDTEQNEVSKGEEYTDTLTSVNWQGTKVYDEDGNDLTEENSNFIGLAKYDEQTNRYEFFDKETGETRGDEGVFFVSNDGTKRILISETMDYQAVVDLTELNDEIFTYKRMGKDADGNEVEIYVEHIPYNESELEFTNESPEMVSETGEIMQNVSGVEILDGTLWNGTSVKDSDGNDVTEYNSNFISIAKFDKETNKYEFFDIESGDSRRDFGYFDVINDNKIRAHVSVGENSYGAVLEVTELNNERFTYKRMGEDAEGNEIEIFVEHEPYTGEYNPSFGF